jgi:class 3 adenylate cyclase
VNCPACQRDNPPESNFCNHCGARMSGSSPTSVREPRDYTPAHLARRILTTRFAVEGERKPVTVLFVDLKGSVELSAGRDPEEWHQVMDRFFERLTRGVHRFEGTVNQYTGDGVMALFGAPIAHEDHAQRACYAALFLRDELRRFSQELRRERGLDLHVRMGMNSGNVVVGRIGDDLRMDYTAQGAVVGLAARMQQIAEPGRIYLTEHTAALVPGYFELEDLGGFNIRGIPDPVTVQALEGVGPVQTRLDLARARGLSPFVGRNEELAALDAAFDAASDGEGPVVGLVANPGLGKSRLCFEWLDALRAKELPILEVRCFSHRRMVPFAPVLQLLRQLFGITDADDPEMARDKIAGRTVRLDPELAPTLPGLFEFLGVPDAEPPLRDDPVAREQQTLDVTGRLLEARTAAKPGVLLIEDLHWLDAASDVFLANLIGSGALRRTVLLLNYRPEYRAAWMDLDAFRPLRIEPLGDAAADALLADLLGGDESVAGLAERIREHTRGNPFFIEEVLRALIESGALQGERGGYRAPEAIEDLGMPPTLQALLTARIDRLPAREKQVLQDAAVLGRRFPEAALELLSGEDPRALAETLRTLVDADFLVEESLYPRRQYAFQHGLTHQVALEGQLVSRRRAVHRRAALVREEIHADKLDEHAALLAHHWDAAGEPLAAAHWHRRAALWAGVNHAPESLRHWRRIHALIGRQGETPEARSLAIEACGQLIIAIGRMGGASEEADRLFDEAMELAARHGDPGAALRVRLHYAHFNTTTGRSTEAERGLAEIGAALAGHADDTLQAAYLHLLPQPRLLVRGTCERVLDECDAAVAYAEAHPGAGSEVLGFRLLPMALTWRGYALAVTGRVTEGRRELERAIDRAAEGHPGAELQAHNCGLALAELMLDPATALHWGSRSLEMAERIGLGESLAEIGYGRACLFGGDPAAALAAFENGLARTQTSHSYAYQELPYWVAISRAKLALGDATGAFGAAAAAVERAPGRGFYGADAHLARALAGLARDAGASLSSIEPDLAEAEQLARAGSAASRLPFVARARAECERRRGDRAAQRTTLSAARDAFAEMGANRLHRELERELANLEPGDLS